MMFDGGITEGVEVGGGGGGGEVIISDLLRKENQETRLDEHKKTDDGFKTTFYLSLPYLLLQRSIILFAKNLYTARKKNPSSLFFY